MTASSARFTAFPVLYGTTHGNASGPGVVVTKIGSLAEFKANTSKECQITCDRLSLGSDDTDSIAVREWKMHRERRWIEKEDEESRSMFTRFCTEARKRRTQQLQDVAIELDEERKRHNMHDEAEEHDAFSLIDVDVPPPVATATCENSIQFHEKLFASLNNL